MKENTIKKHKKKKKEEEKKQHITKITEEMINKWREGETQTQVNKNKEQEDKLMNRGNRCCTRMEEHKDGRKKKWM